MLSALGVGVRGRVRVRVRVRVRGRVRVAVRVRVRVGAATYMAMSSLMLARTLSFLCSHRATTRSAKQPCLQRCVASSLW
jgi:hypothetical protein